MLEWGYQPRMIEIREIAMDATIQTIQGMLNTLNADNLKTAMRFIQFLQSTQNENVIAKNSAAFNQLQTLFDDDKGGYVSEDDVIQDLAAFRRERLAK